MAALRVLVSGASGLIGTELIGRLRRDGHVVSRLVRHKPEAPDEILWDAKTLDPAVLNGIDAVINLSGATVGRIPWTAAYKRTLVSSRVEPTTALAEAIVAAARAPEVFLSASAVGYYGDRPGIELTEDSPRGEGFFPDLVQAWEHAANIAAGATRVVNMRSAVIVAHDGGLAPVRLLTSFGLGSRFGSGRQYWPWISLRDEAAAIAHLLTSNLSGPVILAGPTPATSDEVTRAYATELHRPYFLRVPAFAPKLLGEAGERLLLDDMKVVPTRLTANGFDWRDETITQAVAAISD